MLRKLMQLLLPEPKLWRAFIQSQSKRREYLQPGDIVNARIASPDGRFFAQVLMDRPGQGTGWWNETPFAGHAHSPLGKLRRDDACWVNQCVSVCAW